MDETFQRLFVRADHQVLSLNVQAARGPVRVPERSQLSLLIRHFLERFFNHETASPDGDAKTRMVQIAVATGLPGLLVSVYLWPVYHPFRNWPPGSDGNPPAYWLQVNHHFFFVLYSFIAMGIATVFEWDLFFPDLLDVFVLGPLPLNAIKVFVARVAAIALFIAGFLFDANFLAPLVLPLSTDPVSLPRFLAGHVLAVLGSGLFAAVFILSLQGLLLATLGERLFRKISLLFQGSSIAALLMLMLLFPVLSGVVPVLLETGSVFARWLPPFWFLGIYQRLLEGPSALPIYTSLAQTGCAALVVVGALAIIAYPIAYRRRVRQLIEGPPTRRINRFLARPLHRLLHASAMRLPARRAVFHFISQTVLRVPRYRIYLVLYGGVGLSVVTSGILRFSIMHRQVHMEISADGLRAAVPIIAFWIIAGLRMAFISDGNQRGNWVFRIVHGRPAQYATAWEQFNASKVWALICASITVVLACLGSRLLAPPELLTVPATATQLLIAAGACLLLADCFFLNVTTVAFTGSGSRQRSNLAFNVLKYFAFFPIVAGLPPVLEPWLEGSIERFALAAAVILIAHLLLVRRHRQIVQEYCNQLELEDDEEEFPMKLGLRY
jgi:hypothetical protein